MHIRYLETIIWLSELKNFRMTGEQLNLTPAAISSRISATEEELGIKLFERGPRDVKVTPEGAAFIDGAREIVRRYSDLVAAVSPSAPVEGTVRIGLAPSMVTTILPGIIASLRAQFPRVRVNITTDVSSSLVMRLQNREIDIALGIADKFAGPIISRHLCTFGMFWIANKNTPHIEGTMQKEDILNLPIIGYDRGTTSHKFMIDYLCQDPISHYANSLATIVSMAESGIGIAVLPPVFIQNQLRSGLLRVLDVRPSFPPIHYSTMYLENSASKLAPLVATIAFKEATKFCGLYDDLLASQTPPPG